MLDTSGWSRNALAGAPPGAGVSAAQAGVAVSAAARAVAQASCKRLPVGRRATAARRAFWVSFIDRHPRLCSVAVTMA